MKGGIVIVLLAMLVVPGFIVHTSEAISCRDVNKFLKPCVVFLKEGGNVPEACCDGLQDLKDECQSRADRQTACECAQDIGMALRLRPDYAETLPSRCGVLVTVPVSPIFDCSRVNSLMYESYK